MTKAKKPIPIKISFRTDPFRMIVTVLYPDGRRVDETYDPTNPLHIAIFKAAATPDPPTPAERKAKRAQPSKPTTKGGGERQERLFERE